MNKFETSPKYLAARDSLPEELQEVYKQLVEDYSFRALTRHGRGWVSYEVLADLIRDGWRPLATDVNKETGKSD